MKSHPRILIIIPCYNEAGSIEALLREAALLGDGYATVVIDDGSSDATYEKAVQLSAAVRLLRNLGIGGAVQTGIKYAALHGFDFCVQIDGDGQHPPAEILKLLETQRATGCSIIVGSRYLTNDTFRSTFARRFGGKAIAAALNLLFRGNKISDPTSGMRLMSRAAIEFFAETYPHDFPEPISLAWALRRGLTIGECSVRMRPRQQGTSSIVGWKPIIYMFRVLGYIVLARASSAHVQE